MSSTPPPHANEAGTKHIDAEHQEFLGYEDPHRAALEDNPELQRNSLSP